MFLGVRFSGVSAEGEDALVVAAVVAGFEPWDAGELGEIRIRGDDGEAVLKGERWSSPGWPTDQ